MKTLSLEEFIQLPTEQKREYLTAMQSIVETPECPFWVDRLYYAIERNEPSRLALIDERLGKIYIEMRR